MTQLTKQILILSIVVLVFAGAANADDTLKIVCDQGGTTCAAGGIQTTANTNPTFSLAQSKDSGTLWLAILVPTGSPAIAFTVNGNTPDAGVLFTSGDLWTALGESGGGTDHNFSATQSNTTGTQPSGFTVYDVSLGSYTAGQSVAVSFTFSVGTGFPLNTSFVGFIEGADDAILSNTPLSESLLVSNTPVPAPVPEPGTLALFGSGLLAIGALIRRRLVA